MINIINKEDCAGCNACLLRCPASCISMDEDEQGFLYPKADVSKCINCGLCERVCPVVNQGEPRVPLCVSAAKNKDKDIIQTSSSGGIFYVLAQTVINEGGVVFGARFDDEWQVVHDWTETLDGLQAFQGSKYVQSKIGKTYQQAEDFLKAGRKVMFTGTPCQIKGLVLFLRKDYGEQLLKVDVICHGVPSPAVWREYLKYIVRPQGAPAGGNAISVSPKEMIGGISFRDKKAGWEKYAFSILYVANDGGPNSVSASKGQEFSNEYFEPFTENLYMRIFLKNLALRPSCYKCPSKAGKSYSDLTIGDFWGAKTLCPDMYNKDGVSLILNYSNSYRLLDNQNVIIAPSTYDAALRSNPSIADSAVAPPGYNKFWDTFLSKGLKNAISLVPKMKRPLYQRIKGRIAQKLPNSIKRLLKHILCRSEKDRF